MPDPRSWVVRRRSNIRVFTISIDKMPELMRMALQPEMVKYHGLAGKKDTNGTPK